jgi:hypothetical protein
MEVVVEQKRGILVGSILLTVLLAAGAGINSSIRVADGEFREGKLTTLNGQITIGDGATVKGECESVNGAITVGMNSRVASLSAVNGRVKVGEDTIVAGNVQAVNGPVFLASGARATGVATVNGRIKLTGAEVDRDVMTVNGDIALLDGSTVGGDVVIEEPDSGSSRRERPLRIELEDGSIVEGDVIVEDPEMPAELYLRGGSRVMGRIENAKVIEE